MIDREAFPDPLVIEVLDSRENGRTVVRHYKTFRYYDSQWNECFTIKPGAISDLTSSPIWIRWLFPQFDYTVFAAVVHDEALKVPGFRADGTPRTRKDCDKLYRNALKACGAGWWTCYVKYRSVRLGSRKAWDAYRSAESSASA